MELGHFCHIHKSRTTPPSNFGQIETNTVAPS